MATETIKEFLVLLGYKQDESSLKKFEQGIASATKTVFALAAAVEAMAIGMGVMVTRFAAEMETLYFASRRVGSSAASLKAMELAARDLGAGAGEATGAIEALAAAFRTNPGNMELAAGLLAKVGLQLKFNADGSVDAADAWMKLIKAYKAMSSPGNDMVAAQYAEMLGTSEQLAFSMMNNGDLTEKYNKKLGEMSPNLNAAAKDSNRFMSDIRDLQLQLEMVGVTAESAIRDKLFKNLEGLDNWVQSHRTQLGASLATAIDGITESAADLASVLGDVIDKLKWFDKFSGGVSTKVLGLGLAFRLFGGGAIASGIGSLLKGLAGRGAAVAAGEAAAGGAAGELLGPVTLGVAGGWALDKYFPDNWLAQFGGWIGNKLYDSPRHRAEDYQRALRDMGWSPAVAAGIVANFARESHLDPSASGDNGTSFGLGQWHDGARLLDFKRLFGHDLSQATDMEQLRFTDWELRNHPEYGGAMLKAAQNSESAARIFSRYYERPANAAVEADRRAGIAANISPQTTIHVNGAGDATQVAKRVADQQKQVNADLVRNFTLLAQ